MILQVTISRTLPITHIVFLHFIEQQIDFPTQKFSKFPPDEPKCVFFFTVSLNLPDRKYAVFGRF